jgi:hypothetical protein
LRVNHFLHPLERKLKAEKMRLLGYLVSRVLKLMIWTNSTNKKSTWDQRLIMYKNLDSPGCQTAIGAFILMAVIVAAIWIGIGMWTQSPGG